VEAVRTKYYGGLISTVFSPEQMEIHGDEGHDSSEVISIGLIVGGGSMQDTVGILIWTYSYIHTSRRLSRRQGRCTT